MLAVAERHIDFFRHLAWFANAEVERYNAVAARNVGESGRNSGGFGVNGSVELIRPGGLYADVGVRARVGQREPVYRLYAGWGEHRVVIHSRLIIELATELIAVGSAQHSLGLDYRERQHDEV